MMETGVRDEIRREVLIEAPLERVWRAISDPAEISRWFGQRTRGQVRVGGALAFWWEDDGEHEAVVDVVEPPGRLVYRWCLDAGTPVEQGPTTRVEFRLEPAGTGTRLTLVESGFAAIPLAARDRHFADNSKGWTDELGELSTYVTSA